MSDHIAIASSIQLTLGPLQMKNITDFKTITIGARVIRKQFKLMGQTATHRTVPEQTVVLDYVPPEKGGIDWNSEAMKTDTAGILTIAYMGGRTETLSQISLMEIGEMKADQENEMVMPIKFAYDNANGPQESNI